MNEEHFIGPSISVCPSSLLLSNGIGGPPPCWNVLRINKKYLCCNTLLNNNYLGSQQCKNYLRDVAWRTHLECNCTPKRKPSLSCLLPLQIILELFKTHKREHLICLLRSTSTSQFLSVGGCHSVRMSLHIFSTPEQVHLFRQLPLRKRVFRRILLIELVFKMPLPLPIKTSATYIYTYSRCRVIPAPNSYPASTTLWPEGLAGVSEVEFADKRKKMNPHL